MAVVIDRNIGRDAGNFASQLGLPRKSFNPNQDIYNSLNSYFSGLDPNEQIYINYGPEIEAKNEGLYRQTTAQDIMQFLSDNQGYDFGVTPQSFNSQGDYAVNIDGDPTSNFFGSYFDDLGSGNDYGVPEYIRDSSGNFTQLTDAQRVSYTPELYKQEQEKKARNKGFLGKYVGPAMKVIVPAAIGAVATAGLGSALSGALSGANGLSSGALSLASQGSLIPSSAFASGASGGITGVAAGNAANSGGFGSFLGDTALKGALKGGLQGYLTGGDLSSALKGAGLGGLSGGFGDGLGESIGLGQIGQDSLTDGLISASGKAGGGDYSGALLSGALGGGASYVSGGGDIPGLGSIGNDTNDGYGVLGTIGKTLGVGKQADPSGLSSGALNLAQGGGLYDLTDNNSTSIIDNVLGDNKMNLAQALGAGYEAYSSKQAEDKAKDAMMKYLEQNQAAYNPYLQAGQDALGQLQGNLSTGYSYDQLQDDPGYQFQLDEGLKSIDRSQSARGGLYSGAALKEALGYSQGLANQSYNDGYNRWLSQNNQLSSLAGQGLTATNQYAQNNNDIGNVIANSAITRNNIDSALLSKLLGGTSLFESYL